MAHGLTDVYIMYSNRSRHQLCIQSMQTICSQIKQMAKQTTNATKYVRSQPWPQSDEGIFMNHGSTTKFWRLKTNKPKHMTFSV